MQDNSLPGILLIFEEALLYNGKNHSRKKNLFI
jgi:hypothetical protein